MTLCFLQAFSKAKLPEGGITEQEYVQHLLAHFRGVRHPHDDLPGIENPLAAIEPWVASLRKIALAPGYEPLQDTSTYEELFYACLEGNLDRFRTAFEALGSQASPNPLQPAACLAAQNQQCDILRYCLDRGAAYDRYLNRAGQKGAYSPEMLELLLATNWFDIQHSAEVVEEQILHFGNESLQANWLREQAAKGRLEMKSSTSSAPAKSGEETDKSREQGGSGDKTKKTEETGEKNQPKKGAGSRDPKQRPTPEQLEKWFGDVPW